MEVPRYFAPVCSFLEGQAGHTNHKSSCLYCTFTFGSSGLSAQRSGPRIRTHPQVPVKRCRFVLLIYSGPRTLRDGMNCFLFPKYLRVTKGLEYALEMTP